MTDDYLTGFLAGAQAMFEAVQGMAGAPTVLNSPTLPAAGLTGVPAGEAVAPAVPVVVWALTPQDLDRRMQSSGPR
ncbi:MAG: hypothetical protein H7Y33_05410 [Cytophagales bacterium]|nr:hypothetical protein [Rhizobacter sp.]